MSILAIVPVGCAPFGMPAGLAVGSGVFVPLEVTDLFNQGEPGSPGGLLPVGLTVLETNVFAAVVAWWKAEPQTAAICPGGLVNARAAARQAYPYCRMYDLENFEPTSPDDLECEVAFSVFAADDNAGVSGDALARDAGDRLLNLLAATTGRDPWRFNYLGAPWQEAGLLWMPPGQLEPAGTASGGRAVWRYDLWVKLFLTATES